MEISGSNFRTIVFKDSLNFISGSLASFYDTFGLTDSQLEKKPNFPHLFNKMENIGRVLPHLPSLRYYSIKNMKANERTEFLKFYEKNCNQEFDLKEKLFDYCLNDVQILRYNFCEKYFDTNSFLGNHAFALGEFCSKSLQMWSLLRIALQSQN